MQRLRTIEVSTKVSAAADSLSNSAGERGGTPEGHQRRVDLESIRQLDDALSRVSAAVLADAAELVTGEAAGRGRASVSGC